MARVREAQGGFGWTNGPETETLSGARGAVAEGNLRIHSLRLPGLVAHQEVLLGAPGELLTLRHDAFDRRCYMPGILLAIRQIMHHEPTFLVGLDTLMWR
jgi:4-hydroxy-tetrahydrodipicolinate reductase